MGTVRFCQGKGSPLPEISRAWNGSKVASVKALIDGQACGWEAAGDPGTLVKSTCSGVGGSLKLAFMPGSSRAAICEVSATMETSHRRPTFQDVHAWQNLPQPPVEDAVRPMLELFSSYRTLGHWNGLDNHDLDVKAAEHLGQHLQWLWDCAGKPERDWLTEKYFIDTKNDVPLSRLRHSLKALGKLGFSKSTWPQFVVQEWVKKIRAAQDAGRWPLVRLWTQDTPKGQAPFVMMIFATQLGFGVAKGSQCTSDHDRRRAREAVGPLLYRTYNQILAMPRGKTQIANAGVWSWPLNKRRGDTYVRWAAVSSFTLEERMYYHKDLSWFPAIYPRLCRQLD